MASHFSRYDPIGQEDLELQRLVAAGPGDERPLLGSLLRRPISRRTALKGAAAVVGIAGLESLSGGLLTPTTAAADGQHFPGGQCTWWADERFHQYTGLWVPWYGDAATWVTGARNAGWYVSKTPRVGSIAVFQPYVNGAGSAGHVSIVETIWDGTAFQTSNMNWAGSGSSVVNQWFQTRSSGVDFIYGPSATTWLNGSVGYHAWTGYSFWARAGGTYGARLRPSSADADLYFYRWDPSSQNWVYLTGSWYGGTTEERVSWYASANALVYAWVYGYSGSTGFQILLPADGFATGLATSQAQSESMPKKRKPHHHPPHAKARG